jgi:ribonuclease D
VQLATGGDIFLIDPLALDNIAPLGELMASPSVVKLFHAASHDIRSLDRDWRFRVNPLFDTSIAAAFVGHRSLGLASLLKERLDVDIPKSKRLQRADWTIRPISAELQQYAAADVRYLHRIALILQERLDELGRTEWVREECERLANVRYVPPDVDAVFLTVKGSRDLDGRGLAVLRSLHGFREREARNRDRPPFKIFSDAAMVTLAANRDCDLSEVKGIGRYAYGRRASGVSRAIREGLDAAPVRRPCIKREDRPRLRVRERKAARERLRLLKQWRLDLALTLNLDPGLLWPAKSLERISANPYRVESELHDSSVRRWQRQEFTSSLSELVARL